MLLLGLALGGCQTIEPMYGQAPTDVQPAPPEPEARDCNAWEFQDETYDCSTLDRCDLSEENLAIRVACCDCDPEMCDGPPEGSCDRGP